MNEVKAALDVPTLVDLCERTANDDEWQEWYGYAIRTEHAAFFDGRSSSGQVDQYQSNLECEEKGWQDE